MKKFFYMMNFVTISLFGLYDEHQIINWQSEYEINLEDGSIWHIKADAEEIMNWKNDALSFEAIEPWFKNDVNCFLINKKNKKRIEISLVSAPTIYNSESHWIAYIDPKKSILFLDNGVIFSLYENDREIFKKWKPDDFVIIGDYSSALSKSKNILFNYRTKEFVFGELN